MPIRNGVVVERHPGPLEVVLEGEGEGTQLTFTIHIEPGPLGWLTLLAAAALSRGAVAHRAQRAVHRACAALLEHTAPRERRSSVVSGDAKAARRRRKPRKGRN